ncbi:MAG TPA: Gmad2 immunoglobulin-like domain-containing protein, partial [Nocardioides sp.]|nr:Gmad2 immunoglobulin-like domain-containing protein [Nocardioides sp.]
GRWSLAGGALLATAVVVAGVAVLTRPDTDRGADPVGQPTASGSHTVPGSVQAVYYLGKTPQGPRLFREFRWLPATTRLAPSQYVEQPPTDPDYFSAWPEGAFLAAYVDYPSGLITVQLADRSLQHRPAGMSPAEARLAIEQVIYTVQAYAQQPLPVQFEAEGNPIGTVYDIPTSEPLAASPQLDVLALVSISNPAEGRVVEGGFSADGVASSFEGTVPWELRDETGEVVRSGSAQGTMEDHLTPWKTDTIDVSDLPAGTYTFVAMTDDPSGGEGGGPTTDTRTITVR